MRPSKISLAAILGFASCESQNNYSSFFPRMVVEDTPINPPDKNDVSVKKSSKSFFGYTLLPINSSFNHQADISGPSENLRDELYAPNYFGAMVSGLPGEIVDPSTSVDLGVAMVAAKGDSLFFRTLYSPAYELSLHDDLRLRRYSDDSRKDVNPLFFNRYEDIRDVDDPERIEREEGMVVSSLLKWIWDWDLFTPLRNTANEVRAYSNEIVRDTLGPNSEIDYTGKRVVFGYNVPIDSFYLEFDAWAEIDDPKANNGLTIQMVMPFGIRRN